MISRLKNWLHRQRDKLTQGPFRDLYNTGNWCVVYPNGKRSVWLDYRSAMDLAGVFDGKVLHRNELEP